MKKFLTILFLFSIILFLPIESNAQNNNSKIHPYLQTILLNASNNEMINVYATLEEQYSLDELKQQASFFQKKEKQKEVVRILKEFANQKQQAVRSTLRTQNNRIL